MTPETSLHDLLHRVAPLTPALGAPVACAGGWRLTSEDDLDVVVEALGGRWVASVALGPPGRGVGRAGILAAALAYNGLWRETGDLRIALDGLDGAFILSGAVPAGADAAALLRLLCHLSATGVAWRALLSRRARPPATAREAQRLH